MGVDGESTVPRSLFPYLTTCVLKKLFLRSDGSFIEARGFSIGLLPIGLSLCTSRRSLLVSKLLLVHHILQMS